MTKLSAGTKIEACGKVWTIARVGRIYYHLTVSGCGKNTTFEIPSPINEVHADIAAGIATII